MPLTVFTQRNYVTDFLQAKCDFFYGNRTFCVFETPFGGLSGKRVVDFLLVFIELFSLSVTAEALRANIC